MIRRASLAPVYIAFGAGLLAFVAYALFMLRDSQSEYHLTVLPYRPYADEFRLPASDGTTHALSDFRGRLVILFFGYTRCPEFCPMEMFKLSQVMQRLGADRSRVQVLMITLDPQRDNMQQLRNYVTAFDASFLGMSGTPGQIEQVADTYGIHVRRVKLGDDYTLEHSAAVYVIDTQGRKRLIAGSRTTVDEFAGDLKRMLN